jgi:hypothetical protein
VPLHTRTGIFGCLASPAESVTQVPSWDHVAGVGGLQCGDSQKSLTIDKRPRKTSQTETQMKLSKEDAFLACGLDSGTAKTLTSANFTPAKLRKASDAKLAKFGLEGDVKSRIKRPPIPPATVFSVLDKSRRTCCVCQTPGRSIIIHHIREWHQSRSHAEDDLAVLCLNDHGEAHTQRKLGQNLTPNQIRLHKKNWEKRVQEASGRALVGLSRVQGANWDYINHARLFRLSDQLKVKVTSVPEFRIARGLCMISKHAVHDK